MTTGLQSITLNPVNNEIVCEFLPGSVADGCFIEWHPVNISGREPGYVILERLNGNIASVQLQPLIIPDTSYEVRGFGLKGDTKLHTFPITLQGDLTIRSTGT